MSVPARLTTISATITTALAFAATAGGGHIETSDACHENGPCFVERVVNGETRYLQRYTNCRTIQGLPTKTDKGSYRDSKRCHNRIDFHKTLQWGAKHWRVSYSWLHACVHAEGGHGPQMIWNTQGSGAYGPGQFLPGTYTRMAENAYWSLRRGGLRVSRALFFDPKRPQGRPDTAHGQALAMAHAFSTGRSGEWSASPC